VTCAVAGSGWMGGEARCLALGTVTGVTVPLPLPTCGNGMRRNRPLPARGADLQGNG